MGEKIKLFKTLCCITIITAIVALSSLCFAGIPSSKVSEMTAAFSSSMDTELGDKIEALLDEKGLEIDLGNGVSIPVLGGEVTLVPLVSTDFHQMKTSGETHRKSRFLAYINQGMSGRFLVFLEVIKSQDDEITSFKIVFPSGRGLILNMNPFCIYQIGGSETGISLQDNDDFENSIIVSDTCETFRIIIIVLSAGCLISFNPILCTIAAVMETIYQFIC